VGPYQPDNHLSPGLTHKSNKGNVMILKTKTEKTFFVQSTIYNMCCINKSLSYVHSLYVQEYRHAKIKTLYNMKQRK
jgi:hypothetical protein